MKLYHAASLGLLVVLAGCTGSTSEMASDLTVALDVAATVEGAYEARPNADPKVVADLSRLLAIAQAAVAAWQASSSDSNHAIANAAIAALVEYEATASAK